MSTDGDETHRMVEICSTHAQVSRDENHVSSDMTTLNAGKLKPLNTFEDLIGRRKTALFSSVSSILTSALIIVSPNVETFIFLKMLNQMFDIGYYMGPLILCK
ncbi:hypothetical protein Pmani_024270 [Petrolisthes manimaculis]|uniref:Uncharacterized protein n=1 Tax=Petrolisthes manimaculis TaxID=1843537 RepID=A0AAE1TZI3_9EUCA|nr:hypothetical protein Pmani_024270 [Petrolisthes manimaculis]